MDLVVLGTGAEQGDATDKLHHVHDVVVVAVEEIEDGVLDLLPGRLDGMRRQDLLVGLPELFARELAFDGSRLQGGEAQAHGHLLQAAGLPQLLQVLELRIVLVLLLVGALGVEGPGERVRAHLCAALDDLSDAAGAHHGLLHDADRAGEAGCGHGLAEDCRGKGARDLRGGSVAASGGRHVRVAGGHHHPCRGGPGCHVLCWGPRHRGGRGIGASSQVALARSGGSHILRSGRHILCRGRNGPGLRLPDDRAGWINGGWLHGCNCDARKEAGAKPR
mmetsp:Transcript_139162/g.444077  ORF Transcript_139162/g.444077 Transcript_139162/m.444077 type:complete len:277 (-) Transcript_139162:38-868(-)